MVKQAVIPVAGLGTRMLPASKAIPKCMLPLYNLPIIHYIVKELKDAGINEICIITNPRDKSVKNYFSLNDKLTKTLKNQNKILLLNQLTDLMKGLKLHFIPQTKPAGLADAIYYARPYINGSFIVATGDDIFELNVSKQLIDSFEKGMDAVIATRLVEKEETRLYGIASTVPYKKGVSKITALVEKPQFEVNPPLAVSGRYLFNADIFEKIEKLPENPEKMLTDAIASYDSAYAVQLKGYAFDTGNFIGYAEAFNYYTKLNQKF